MSKPPYTKDLTQFKYCPLCGSALEIAEHGDTPTPACTSETCEFIFWQNAKPAVSGIIATEQGELLLTERAIEPYKGLLDLPGGFLMEYEEPNEGLIRELKEELGVTVTPGEIVGHALDTYGNSGYYVMSIGITATVAQGTPQAQDEIAALEWVDPATVDRTRLAFPSTPRFLDMWITRFGS